MDQFQLALLFGAIIAGIISHKLPHSTLWIGVAMVNFALGSLYFHAGLPYGPAFVLALDASTCLLIYFRANEVWELHAYRVFQLSVLISVLRLSNVIEDNLVYVISLEACNWLFLALIAGTAFLDWIRANGHSIDNSWRSRIRRFDTYLRGSRSKAPFHKVRG